jgi:hypothetical protein
VVDQVAFLSLRSCEWARAARMRAMLSGTVTDCEPLTVSRVEAPRIKSPRGLVR